MSLGSHLRMAIHEKREPTVLLGLSAGPIVTVFVLQGLNWTY